MTTTIYEHGLAKNAANYVPLSPLSFIERTAMVYPTRTSVIHGTRRFTWGETYARCRRLASALVAHGVKRGDTVAVLSPEGCEIARGLVAYDAADAVRTAGLKTAEIEAVLGYEARSAMVHRDDLVVSRAMDEAGEGVREQARG